MRVLPPKEFSICPPINRPASSCQFLRAANATSDDRWRPSCAAPDGSCLRSIPNQSSNQERFCGNGLARRVAEFPAAAPTTTRGTAKFSGLESKCRAQVVSNFPALECVPLAPNTRVRGHDVDAAGVCSKPVHRSRAAGLPNLRRAGQWDKHFLEIEIRPVRGSASCRR